MATDRPAWWYEGICPKHGGRFMVSQECLACAAAILEARADAAEKRVGDALGIARRFLDTCSGDRDDAEFDAIAALHAIRRALIAEAIVDPESEPSPDKLTANQYLSLQAWAEDPNRGPAATVFTAGVLRDAATAVERALAHPTPESEHGECHIQGDPPAEVRKALGDAMRATYPRRTPENED